MMRLLQATLIVDQVNLHPVPGEKVTHVPFSAGGLGFTLSTHYVGSATLTTADGETYTYTYGQTEMTDREQREALSRWLLTTVSLTLEIQELVEWA